MRCIKEGIPMNKPNKLFITVIFSIIAASASLYFSQLHPVNNDTAGELDKTAQPCVIEEKARRESVIPAAGKRRVNILLLGIEGGVRTDTIIFISYDRTESKLSLVSIPRDTYFYEPGYAGGDQRKINAVYGRSEERGCIDAVAKLLGDTTIDYYISVEYEGVEKIIDTIDGVELEVPMDMDIDGVKLAKGKRVLNGMEALHYLRFRAEYPNGDLGRIEAQQKFIRSVISKVQYDDLPGIISRCFGFISTNMPFGEMLEFTRLYINDRVKEVSMHTLPGVSMYKNIGGYNWSYFFHNSEKAKVLMNEIYSIESFEQKQRKRCEPY